MTAGGMLSWSLKGGSLGGFGLGFSVPAFHGTKALQKANLQKMVSQLFESLCACL